MGTLLYRLSRPSNTILRRKTILVFLIKLSLCMPDNYVSIISCIARVIEDVREHRYSPLILFQAGLAGEWRDLAFQWGAGWLYMYWHLVDRITWSTILGAWLDRITHSHIKHHTGCLVRPDHKLTWSTILGAWLDWIISSHMKHHTGCLVGPDHKLSHEAPYWVPGWTRSQALTWNTILGAWLDWITSSHMKHHTGCLVGLDHKLSHETPYWVPGWTGS